MLQHHDRKNAAELEGVVRVLCNLSWLEALHEQVSPKVAYRRTAYITAP